MVLLLASGGCVSYSTSTSDTTKRRVVDPGEVSFISLEDFRVLGSGASATLTATRIAKTEITVSTKVEGHYKVRSLVEKQFNDDFLFGLIFFPLALVADTLCVITTGPMALIDGLFADTGPQPPKVRAGTKRIKTTLRNYPVRVSFGGGPPRTVQTDANGRVRVNMGEHAELALVNGSGAFKVEVRHPNATRLLSKSRYVRALHVLKAYEIQLGVNRLSYSAKRRAWTSVRNRTRDREVRGLVSNLLRRGVPSGHFAKLVRERKRILQAKRAEARRKAEEKAWRKAQERRAERRREFVKRRLRETRYGWDPVLRGYVSDYDWSTGEKKRSYRPARRSRSSSTKRKPLPANMDTAAERAKNTPVTRWPTGLKSKNKLTDDEYFRAITLHGYWKRRDNMVIHITQIRYWNTGGYGFFLSKGKTWLEALRQHKKNTKKNYITSDAKFRNIKYAGGRSYTAKELWLLHGGGKIRGEDLRPASITLIDHDTFRTGTGVLWRRTRAGSLSIPYATEFRGKK